MSFLSSNWFHGALLAAGFVGSATVPVSAIAQSARYDELAKLPYQTGYLGAKESQQLTDELFYQRGVQTYLWALPALNMYAMKEGSERVFGKGYNVLPIFKERLNAETLITTPNSDVIYALGYLDLKEDGPMVIEVPPGLQGILDDFWQRPICSVGEIDGRKWCGEWVCPAPIKAMAESISSCRRSIRRASRPVISPSLGYLWCVRFLARVLQRPETTRGTCPGHGTDANIRSAKRKRQSRCNSPMPQPSPPTCSIASGSAFDMLSRFIDHEYVDPWRTCICGAWRRRLES